MSLSLHTVLTELEQVDGLHRAPSTQKFVIVQDENENRYEIVAIGYWAGNALLTIRPEAR